MRIHETGQAEGLTHTFTNKLRLQKRERSQTGQRRQDEAIFQYLLCIMNKYENNDIEQWSLA